MILTMIVVVLSGCDGLGSSRVPTAEEYCDDRGGISYIETEENFNVIFCDNGDHIHEPLRRNE
jgi:hypothetical protein